MSHDLRQLQVPSDPPLEALLDRALRPGGPLPGPTPAALVDRICIATLSRVGRRRTVLGRIGQWPVRALAAVVIVGVMVSLTLVGQIVRDAHDRVEIRTELAALTNYQGPAAAIDHEIAMLGAEVDYLSAGGSEFSRQQMDVSLMDLDVQTDGGAELF